MTRFTLVRNQQKTLVKVDEAYGVEHFVRTAEELDEEMRKAVVRLMRKRTANTDQNDD